MNLVKRQMSLGGLLAILCCPSLHAQNLNPIRKAMGACGPADSRFDVSLNAQPSVNLATSDRAIVYVIGNWFGGMLAGPTVRVAVNGSWVGALRGAAYFAISLRAGTYHFCVQGQGHTPPGPKEVALNVLQLKPGSTYYLLADSARVSTSGLLGLEEINADEGKLLLAQSKPVVAAPRAAKEP